LERHVDEIVVTGVSAAAPRAMHATCTHWPKEAQPLNGSQSARENELLDRRPTLRSLTTLKARPKRQPDELETVDVIRRQTPDH
jgi:hypothetical protein